MVGPSCPEGAIKPDFVLPDIIEQLWRHEMQPLDIGLVARLQGGEVDDCAAEGAGEIMEGFVGARVMGDGYKGFVVVSLAMVFMLMRVLSMVLVVLGMLDLLIRIGMPVARVVAVALFFARMTIVTILVMSARLDLRIVVATIVGRTMMVMIHVRVGSTMLRMVR